MRASSTPSSWPMPRQCYARWCFVTTSTVSVSVDDLVFQAYLEMPPVTRVYTTACVITTLAVQLEIVSPFQLYFNPLLIMRQFQLWRIVTTFLFFGTFGFNFLFNMIFTYRYCRMLEEGSFRGKSADFVLMFIFGALSMITFAFFVNLLFLGQVKLESLWFNKSLRLFSGIYHHAGVRLGQKKSLYPNEFLWPPDI